jgi:hypothetical protein
MAAAEEMLEEAAGKYAPGELETFINSIKAHETWFEGKRGVQDRAGPNEDPVLRTRELERRAREVRDEVAKLSKRKAPPKKSSASASSSSTTTASSTSNSGGPPTETAHDEL